VSPAFSEDPVRILRIARFAARYAALGFSIAPETMELMRAMVKSGEVDSLVAERVWKEYERALSENNPEVFFAVLAECGALPKLFPHLKVSGRGMQALKASVHITPDTSIRCACAWHALPEEGADIEPKVCIQNMCERYRAPVLFRELAILTALYHEKTLHCQTFSAEKLLDLLLKLDAFRREERFKQFLLACEAIAKSRSIHFDSARLFAIYKIAQAIDTKAIQASGITGPSFAAEINRLRLKAIGVKLHDERS
jgi:tRNA nucleotidyltransferase (CCA-adding enzyme)